MLFILFLLSIINYSCSSQEINLRNKLFKDYNKNIRPVINYNDNISLNISIDVKNLEYFNQVSETMSLNLWITMIWEDQNLKWNASNYGIDYLKLSSNDIWLPDLVLYNSAEIENPYNVLDQMIISNTGIVTLIKPTTLKFSCPLDLHNFPFDSQNCKMEFGSWHFNKQYLNIKYDIQNPSNINNFIKHNEWHLQNISHTDLELEYLCCPNEIWTVLKFDLSFNRYQTSYDSFITMTVLLTLSACIISTFNLKLYNRVYVLIFIPLTIIWLLQSIIKKIPVIGYFTIMDQILLTSFIVCELYTIESGLLFNLYNNYNLYYEKIKIKNNNIYKNPKYNKLNFIKKYNDNTNYRKLFKLNQILLKFDIILRLLILISYILFILIIYYMN
jgi:nicotinic acetylcholine receptor, invertebrate